ncbi:hypothetical protein BDW02DRAFT_584934 [Decorospora gaudefroyi]|uniref:Mediator of RNA polymerase II transcription subunit 11 n=1 Tax=Decorospora gaudefroyi TaxID=184978 RepID=A0A6A5KTT8_9PLEO|nr:hypothetical protein BDW02DRAFT_584934 [Decorospora gaudefroyi]
MSTEAAEQVSQDAEQVAQDADEQQPDGTESGKHAEQVRTYREVAAKNIDTLNEINNQIPKMLKYFATAISQLTNDPIAFGHPDLKCTPGTLEARKEVFRVNATFCGLSVDLIRGELVKQINALEKCGVIPKSHPKFTVAQRQGHAQSGKEDKVEVVDPEKEVKNGGYGEFDVGVLNARASSGQVGTKHVLDRAKAILEELNGRAGVPNGDQVVVDG